MAYDNHILIRNFQSIPARAGKPFLARWSVDDDGHLLNPYGSAVSWGVLPSATYPYTATEMSINPVDQEALDVLATYTRGQVARDTAVLAYYRDNDLGPDESLPSSAAERISDLPLGDGAH